MKFIENDLASSPPDPDLASDIQGNIVGAYNRTQTEFVFVRLPGATVDERRDSLSRMLRGVRPSTATFHEQHLSDGTELVNVLVTCAGLRNLGHEAILPYMDPAFAGGARASRLQRELNDPAVKDWAQEFQQEFDLLVLLAHDGINPSLVWLQKNFPDAYYAIHGNRLDRAGRPLGSANEPHYEPFGFRDGLSNPIFIKEAEKQRTGAYSMARPLSRCLSRDPASNQGFGSYFVFRKLHQDVGRFNTRLDKLLDDAVKRAEEVAAIQFGGSRGTPARFVAPPSNQPPTDYRQAAQLARGGAAAREDLRDFILRRAVGRDREGYPFTDWHKPLSQRQQPIGAAGRNDFDFGADRDGRVCPLQAHARKVNPRGLTGDADERKHVIARRGIPYGKAGDEDCGMLFLCAQASIGEQFEHLQRRWANNDGRAANLQSEPTPGYDNIAAQPPPAKNNSDVLYESVELSSAFYECVRLRGAEYLFAPSLSGLLRLTAPLALPNMAPNAQHGIPAAPLATRPNGLLSFLFHVTSVSAYRAEDNEEIERSFARFGVPAKAQAICREMEKACIAFRRALANGATAPQKAQEQGAQRELESLSPPLFALVADEIDQLPPFHQRPRADGSRWFGPLADAPANWLLLDYVYAFCYADDVTVDQLTSGLRGSQYDWAIQHLGTLRGKAVIAAIQALCQAMATECSQRTWRRIW